MSGRLLPAAGILIATGAFTVVVVASDLSVFFFAWDTRAYYEALRSGDPYAEAGVGVIGSFLYPPPFLQLLAPAGRLPWPLFLFGWTAVMATLAWTMLRRVPSRLGLWRVALVLLALYEVAAGNINLVIAYGAIVGLTVPAAWAVPALTKVTPGVGALWLAFRGRWFDFILAVVVTAAVAGVSWFAAPDLWADWLALMLGEDVGGLYAWSIPFPLTIRLPAAVVVLWWAARTDRAWAVPVACMLALPVIWFNGLSLLIGTAALLDARPSSTHAAASASTPAAIN